MKSQKDAIFALLFGFLATTALQVPWIVNAHIEKAERIAAYEQSAQDFSSTYNLAER